MCVMHEHSVEFRISGAALVPATVTTALKLEPSLVREVGERRGATRVWDKALWAYDGFAGQHSNCWSSLEDGFHFLLDKLEPLKTRIEEYKQDHDVFFWCGHFQSSFDGGPKLSAKLLRRLADFGVDVYIDNHFCEPRRC